MIKYKLILLLLITSVGFLRATTTYTVGASGASYTTIAAAYAACTTATDYVIEIQSDYDYNTETTTGVNAITLAALTNKDATNTVTIRPANGVTLSFTGTATSIFILNGANWVIFDGRAAGTGASAWTMINTITNARRVFTLQGNACNNVFKYCNIQGNNNNVTQDKGGIFYFSKTNTSGNNNNTITDCVFTNYSSCRSYIYSRSDNVATGNVNNTVTNCQFIGTEGYSIWLETSTSDWAITNNHFYQTTNQTITGKNVKQIYINTVAGTDFTITGNYIGGQAPYCGGNAYSLDSWNYFGGIIFDASKIGGTNTISNNTISNINFTTIAAQINYDGYTFCAIQTAGPSDFVVGSSGNGNTIGDTTGTGNITVACNEYILNAPSFVAINANGTGTISISDNTIGAIDYTTSYANNSDGVSLLNIYATGAVSVTNNTFGNSTPNNITVNSNTNSLNGINHNNTNISSFVIENNIVQNLTANDVTGGIYTTLTGMYINHTPTSLSNNVVQKLTNNVDTLYDFSFFRPNIMGIHVTDIYSGFVGNTTIYNNKILDLITTSNHANNIITITGMKIELADTGKVKIYRNKIRGLKNSATASTGSSIIGMDVNYYGTDTMHVYNNLVLLDDDASSYTKSFKGIQVNGTAITETYHNTVKLNASYSSGSDTSAALSMKVRKGTHFVKNNIFQNLITGGSGPHYAQLWDTIHTTSNIRNNYNEAPNASKLINWGGTEKSNATWITAVGSATELTGTISISSSSGNPSSSDVVGSKGTPIATITDDYDLNPRSSLAPWIGAFELITALPIELLDISAKCQKSKLSNSEYGATIKWTTAMEINSDYFIVEGSKDGFVWEVKDTLDGAGTLFQPTNYYYHDDFINPTPENETVVYYRVSQTNFDGEIKTFDIQSCKCEASDKIKIHPIPSNESIVINFGDQNNVPNSFQITDMFGHIIEDITVVGDKANNTSYTLDISKYPSGRYIIKINDWKMKEDGIFIKQ